MYSGAGNTWTGVTSAGSGGGTNVAVDLASEGTQMAPKFVDAVGGFFDFGVGGGGDRYFTFKLPAMAGDNVGPYTVSWCGVRGSGTDVGGVARGAPTSLASSAHMVGWQTGQIRGSGASDVATHVANGAAFCVAHVVDIDEKTLTVYLDGKLVATSTMTTPDAASGLVSDTFTVGAGGYTGGISSIAVYSRALDSMSVNALHSSLGASLGIVVRDAATVASMSMASVPVSNLHLWLDATRYMSGSTTWPDMSPLQQTVPLKSRDDGPVFKTGFGGYFSFTGGPTEADAVSVTVPHTIPADTPYTVFWCGIGGAGDPKGGVFRGTAWAKGQHIIGWQASSIWADNVDERFNGALYNSIGDNFCVCEVNHVDIKTVRSYYNGEHVGERVYTTWGPPPQKNVWAIGYRSIAAGKNTLQYKGGIQQVLVYDRALLPAEIKQLYNAFAPQLNLHSV